MAYQQNGYSHAAVLNGSAGNGVHKPTRKPRSVEVEREQYHEIRDAHAGDLAKTREIVRTFPWGGVDRVSVKVIGKREYEQILTYEVVPVAWFHGDRLPDDSPLGEGSVVRRGSRELVLSSPVLFRRKQK